MVIENYFLNSDMEKIWFVFNKDHHIGPFSAEELFRMFYDDVIDKHSLIWKEGLKSWEPLSSVHELYSILGETDDGTESVETSDDQIPVYDLDEFKQEKMDSVKESFPEERISLSMRIASEAKENLSEDLNPSEALKEIPERKPEESKASENGVIDQTTVHNENVSTEIKAIEEQQSGEISNAFENVREQIQASLVKNHLEDQSISRQIMAAASVIILVLLTWWILSGSNFKAELQGLGSEDYKRLKDTMHASRGFQVDLALDDEKRVIWLTSNNKGNYLLRVTLKSIENKILSDEEVVMVTQSTLSNQVAKFDQLEILKGRKFIPGYYEAEIYGHELGSIATLKSFLKEKGIAGAWFKDYQRDIRIAKTVLLQGYAPSKFNKLLENFVQKKQRAQKRPLVELKESYLTLMSLMDNVESLFLKTLEKTSKPKYFVDDFNRAYASKVGPVFQGIMNDNKKIHDEISDIEMDRKKQYLEFLTIGKQMGIIVADSVVKSQKYRTYDKKARALLGRELRSQLQEQKRLIKSKLSSFNNI